MQNSFKILISIFFGVCCFLILNFYSSKEGRIKLITLESYITSENRLDYLIISDIAGQIYNSLIIECYTNKFRKIEKDIEYSYDFKHTIKSKYHINIYSSIYKNNDFFQNIQKSCDASVLDFIKLEISLQKKSLKENNQILNFENRGFRDLKIMQRYMDINIEDLYFASKIIDYDINTFDKFKIRIGLFILSICVSIFSFLILKKFNIRIKL